jgi:ABC-type branched-subunit amino acid transport system ATPase component
METILYLHKKIKKGINLYHEKSLNIFTTLTVIQNLKYNNI